MRWPPANAIRRWSGSALLAASALLLGLAASAEKSSRHPEERDGTALIRHRADVMRPEGRHLWSLYSSPEARMNYFEVAERTPLHFHPNGDHRLYVLEGQLLLTAGTNTETVGPGDFIVIPRGVRHSYDVVSPGSRALLLTFDAPPYDMSQTVNLEGPRKP